jgi:hypothetical protein
MDVNGDLHRSANPCLSFRKKNVREWLSGKLCALQSHLSAVEKISTFSSPGKKITNTWMCTPYPSQYISSATQVPF